MKVLVLMSGGLDSTVLAKMLQTQGHEVLGLSIEYGQKHSSQELSAAVKVCSALGVERLQLAIPSLGGSELTNDRGVIPEGHYQDVSMRKTVVPHRNLVMLAHAASVATSMGCEALAYAAHGGDHEVYPDCRPAFVNSLQKTIKLSDWSPLELIAPFVNMTKTDIVAWGNSVQAPMALTWSCYNGRALHCGKCGTCYERKEAFQQAQVPDPTEYES